MFDKNVAKIIFTGPVGAGKTTAINALSDTPVISTEQVATDDVKNRKEKTTVAMDYGMIKLENGESIHLYGTPGQERFNFMWEILADNALGVIILVDNANEDPLRDLEFFLKSFKQFIENKAIVVGITRTDLAGSNKLDDYHKLLQKHGFNPPVFEVDGRKDKEICMLVQALLFSVDQSMVEEPISDVAEKE